MQAIRARLVAIAASALLAWLSSLGVGGITPELNAGGKNRIKPSPRHCRFYSRGR